MTSDFLLLISYGWAVTFQDSHRTVFTFRFSWLDLLGVVLAFWISILQISKLLQNYLHRVTDITNFEKHLESSLDHTPKYCLNLVIFCSQNMCQIQIETSTKMYTPFFPRLPWVVGTQLMCDHVHTQCEEECSHTEMMEIDIQWSEYSHNVVWRATLPSCSHPKDEIQWHVYFYVEIGHFNKCYIRIRGVFILHPCVFTLNSLIFSFLCPLEGRNTDEF